MRRKWSYPQICRVLIVAVAVAVAVVPVLCSGRPSPALRFSPLAPTAAGAAGAGCSMVAAERRPAFFGNPPRSPPPPPRTAAPSFSATRAPVPPLLGAGGTLPGMTPAACAPRALPSPADEDDDEDEDDGDFDVAAADVIFSIGRYRSRRTDVSLEIT